MSIREPPSQLFTEYALKASKDHFHFHRTCLETKIKVWGSSKFCLQRPGSISPNLLFCFNSSSRKCNNYIQFHSRNNNVFISYFSTSSILQCQWSFIMILINIAACFCQAVLSNIFILWFISYWISRQTGNICHTHKLYWLYESLQRELQKMFILKYLFHDIPQQDFSSRHTEASLFAESL